MKLGIGGQNPLWDGTIASAALTAHGHAVTFNLHTIDHFSRDPLRKGSSPALSREAYRPDGNYNRWTACLEHPDFLGRCAIPPVCFEKAGTSFDRLAAFMGTTRESVVTDLTMSDWHGVSLGEDERIAHGLRTAPMRGAVKQFAARILGELRETGGCHERLRSLEDLFVFNPAATKEDFGPHGGKLWHDVGIEIVSRLLTAFGGERVGVTSTHAAVTSRGQPYSNVFATFVGNYRRACALYNEALAATTESVVPLDEGELPFYAIVKDENGLHRMPLQMPGPLSGTDPEKVLASAADEAVSKKRELVAICGKAIMLMLELREERAAATVREGSPYLPAARRFAALAERDLPGFPVLHSGYYVHLDALDALADVEGTIRLPSYLANTFGTERIACADLAHSWQFYAEQAERRADRLTGKDPVALLPALDEAGVTTGVPEELLRPILAMRTAYNAALKDAFGAPDRTQREQQKSWVDDVYRGSFLNGLHKQALAGLDLLRAQALRKELGVAKSLRYWNSRPFALWVATFPGWMEAIAKRTECVPE
ncbi:MAG: hypothetical protein KGI78_04085 [Patescibacteria group bacterium]|nr:hypothetical protein [Patescibacteria group bacterium]MDE2057999.1 hypothetical protein [Patescibacteria group bacterium]